jgi:psiF repeat
MRVLAMVMMGLLLVSSGYAAEEMLTPQQQKMAACSKANKGKKGDAYKQAMSACLAN